MMRRMVERVFICVEQLGALFCILDLAGRVRLKDAGLVEAGGTADSRCSPEVQCKVPVPKEFARCRINPVEIPPEHAIIDFI